MQARPFLPGTAQPPLLLARSRGGSEDDRSRRPAATACAEERLAAALAEHNRVLASAWRARRWQDRARAPLHPRAARLFLYHAATGRARG